MNELSAIVEAWRNLDNSNKNAVLATVVHVKGSAYRRPGARMLILPDGSRIGSISGGCLEGDVAKKAWWFTEGGRPSVRVYDTSSDEDAIWTFGLGCNGVIQVMLERVDADSGLEAMEFLEVVKQSREAAVMATVIRCGAGSTAQVGASVQVGDRLLVQASGVVAGALNGTPTAVQLQQHIAQSLHEKQSRLVYLEDCEVFVEWIGPPVQLVIFGAGHDAIPLVRIASELGWNVTVVDGRPAYATAARFPEAETVAVMHPRDLLAGITINTETVVVMMTHNFQQDGKILMEVLPRQPRYLGMLGPKQRADDLLKTLGLPSGIWNAHAPVGLDIGAHTPATIALSILAEIQAELKGRPGMKLRHRRGPIHEAATEVGEENAITLPAPDQAACEISK